MMTLQTDVLRAPLQTVLYRAGHRPFEVIAEPLFCRTSRHMNHRYPAKGAHHSAGDAEPSQSIILTLLKVVDIGARPPEQLLTR